MDLIACMYKLRPDVAWKDNFVNPYSLDTISKNYLGGEPIPTLEECEAAWEEIKLEKEKSIPVNAALKVFENKVIEGFEYKGHIFQCDEVDQDRWTKGVKLMERHGFETANAVDINNDEWEVTLIEMAEIRDLAEDTWFTHWFEYQGIKNGTA